MNVYVCEYKTVIGNCGNRLGDLLVDGRIIFRHVSEGRRLCGFYYIAPLQGPVAGCCKYDTEPSNYTEDGKFLYKLSDCRGTALRV